MGQEIAIVSDNKSNHIDVEDHAFKMVENIYSNGSTGNLLIVFNSIVGGEGQKLNDAKVPYLCGLIRSGKIPPKEISDAMNKQRGDGDSLKLSNAYFKAENVSTATYVEFVSMIKERFPAALADLVMTNTKLTQADLQNLIQANPGNLSLLAALAKVDKNELEKRK